MIIHEITQTVPGGEPPIMAAMPAAKPGRMLVAVDGSENAARAVDYVGRIAARNPELRITLLTVVNIQADSRDVKPARVRKIAARAERRGREVLEQARATLIEQGVAPDRVRTKTQFSLREGPAFCILSTAAEDGYEVIVLGRCGENEQAGFLLGSVAGRVIQYARGFSVLLVD